MPPKPNHVVSFVEIARRKPLPADQQPIIQHTVEKSLMYCLVCGEVTEHRLHRRSRTQEHWYCTCGIGKIVRV